MANIILKSDARKEREKKILNDIGPGPHIATQQDRENADCIAEKTYEMIKKMRKKER